MTDWRGKEGVDASVTMQMHWGEWEATSMLP
jgi:hypothetical protein